MYSQRIANSRKKNNTRQISATVPSFKFQSTPQRKSTYAITKKAAAEKKGFIPVRLYLIEFSNEERLYKKVTGVKAEDRNGPSAWKKEDILKVAKTAFSNHFVSQNQSECDFTIYLYVGNECENRLVTRELTDEENTTLKDMPVTTDDTFVTLQLCYKMKQVKKEE